MPDPASAVRELQLPEEDVFAEFVKRDWCDGLPIVPPTPERVRAMVAAGGEDPARVLGLMPPLWREASVEKLAVNAVMAGCEPACFPVVLAAVTAMLEPAFNLYGVQATTHPVAPLVIVSGPVARAVGMHAGAGLFGPGFRANATIGRAIRLILMNVGGGWPGRHDMATQGSPAKFSYAIAEREDVTPWPPLSRRGSASQPGQSVVTVFAGEAPHNVNDHVSTTAAGILNNVSDVAATLGSNVGWYMAQSQLLVVLGPEHAATIAADGFSCFGRPALRLRARAPAAWAGSSSAACGACTTGRSGCRRSPTSRRSCPWCRRPKTSTSWSPAARASTPASCPTAPSAAR